MNFSLTDIVVLGVTSVASFAFARWASKKRRARKAELNKKLAQADLAKQSRQVRRAAARKER